MLRVLQRYLKLDFMIFRLHLAVELRRIIDQHYIERSVAIQQRGYRFQQDQEMASERMNCSVRNSVKMRPKLTIIIETKLRLQWIPEQISGWLKRHNGNESIYRYVWKDKQQGGDLYRELRHHGKKYNKRGSGCINGKFPLAHKDDRISKIKT